MSATKRRCRLQSELTIIIFFLEILVNDTAAQSISHVLGVQSTGFLPLALGSTARLVAAILGKECGDRVRLEKVENAVVARRLKGRVAAPLVYVVSVKVDGGRRVAAVHVLGNRVTKVRGIVGGIANSSMVALVLDILLHVADRSLDIGRGARGGVAVGDFVADEEARYVGVLGHGVDDALEELEEVDIPLRVGAVDGDGGVAQVSNDIDARVGEHLHAIIVVAGGVDAVCTNEVGVERHQVGNVALAVGLAHERVDKGGVARGGVAATGRRVLLVGDAANNELRAIGVEEFGSLQCVRLLAWRWSMQSEGSLQKWILP